MVNLHNLLNVVVKPPEKAKNDKISWIVSHIKTGLF